MKLRAPAVPLITVDPYFTVWSPNNTLNFAPTEHWTNKSNSIIGSVIVDGKEYSFFGYTANVAKLTQVKLDIDALSTTVVAENEQVSVTAKFTSPVMLDDYRLLTRPVSYLALSYSIKDGKSHDVKFCVKGCEELCLGAAHESPVVTEKTSGASFSGMRIGNSVQKPLNKSGDDICIDWGYFHIASAGENVEAEQTVLDGKTYIQVKCDASEKTLFCFAYDDIESIEYFGKHLKSYWNKDGQTVEQAIDEAIGEYDCVMARCETFAQKIRNEGIEAGGEKYAELLELCYRQVIAAHKLVLDENGDILYISKECYSNGCAATVDVSYPSTPLFLLYNPELVKGMLRPIYKYAQSEAWTFDFAPHDVGCYPLLNGQVYGENALKYQMPVEECGNMLIMETNLALVTGNADFAAEHLELLESWCSYLIRYGADPEDQLCTDDFAGHLAHNCNLSLKAIMGLRGMAIIMKMLGKQKKSSYYKKEAEKMAEIWLKTAINEDGSSKLAFDQPDTFSMKYNMVWDRAWKTKLFGQKFMDNELKHNLKHFNKYGMPLDNRADYTKSDWTVWTASMASSKKMFERFIAPLWQTYNDSETRVAMTDWYDTKSSRMVSFKHRTVQGGLFMRVLMNKMRETK